jgi:uncharacterized protein (TIGR00288 family)
MQLPERKIALLIDAENAPASKIDVILSELAKYGIPNIRRAYGNWKSPLLQSWEKILHEYAIRPVQQFAYTKGKNAVDIAMVIEAMDLLYTQHLDAFSIVSSDGDFTPLVMRILTNGLKVYGFGEKKTPLPFVNACSTFLYLENLTPIIDSTNGKIPETTKESKTQPKDNSKKTKEKAKETTECVKIDAKLIKLIRIAIETNQNEEGWANLGLVGAHISKQIPFDPRNYGYKKLLDLIEGLDLFLIQRSKKSQIWIREKKLDNHKPSEQLSLSLWT